MNSLSYASRMDDLNGCGCPCMHLSRIGDNASPQSGGGAASSSSESRQSPPDKSQPDKSQADWLTELIKSAGSIGTAAVSAAMAPKPPKVTYITQPASPGSQPLSTKTTIVIGGILALLLIFIAISKKNDPVYPYPTYGAQIPVVK